MKLQKIVEPLPLMVAVNRHETDLFLRLACAGAVVVHIHLNKNLFRKQAAGPAGRGLHDLHCCARNYTIPVTIFMPQCRRRCRTHRLPSVPGGGQTA